MNSKTQQFQNWLAITSLKVTAQIIRFLPYFLTRAILNPFLEIAFFFLKRERNSVEKSLQSILKDQSQIKTIIKKCFKNTAFKMIDMLYFYYHPKKVETNVSVQGNEELKEALQNSNKGIVFVTAHLSNFPLMFMRLVQQGFKINAVIRPMRNKAFGDYINYLSSDWGVNLISTQPTRTFLKTVTKVLDNKELLVFLIDEPSDDKRDITTKLLGKNFSMNLGPLWFARHKNTPIYSMFITQTNKLKYNVDVAPLLSIGEHANEQLYADRLATLIEKYVLTYPEQWGGWFNRRWQKLK